MNENCYTPQTSKPTTPIKQSQQLADCFFSKQAAAGFIRLTPMGRTEKSLSAELESLMASSSMLKPDTFTGPTWAFRARTMVRLSASISTVGIA